MSKSIPFELPVKVEILPIKVADYDRPYSIVGRTVESVGEIYAYLGNKDRADYIVQAINSHKKLVEALENLREELDEDHIHDREDCTGDCPICVIDEALESEKK